MNSISLGAACAARFVFTYCRISSSNDWLGLNSFASTTNAFTIADSIPASVRIVNMVTPTGEPIQTEYATMDTTLVSPSGNSRVSLGIGYNEYSNLFNLKANFSETIPEINPVIKKSLIAPIASVGVGFADSLMLHDAELALGVEFAEKYSVSVFGRSDLTYGLRFGVRF